MIDISGYELVRKVKYSMHIKRRVRKVRKLYVPFTVAPDTAGLKIRSPKHIDSEQD
jgi:hypothetical protein